MYRSLFLFAFFCFSNLTGCSHSVEPPTPPQPAKDPQNYSWTIDTLFYSPSPRYPGQTVIEDLWGVNDTLVYAVCYDAWDGIGGLWKFNGKNWERMDLSAIGAGASLGTRDLQAIKIFSEKDIFVFGDRSFPNPTPPPNFTFQVWAAHYNGSMWQEISIPSGEFILNVDHDSPSMIFCGGKNGQLYQFDGAKWSVDTITNPLYPNLKLDIKVAGTTADNGVLVQARQFDSKTNVWRYWFSKYKDRRITPLDSSVDDNAWGGESFWKSKEGNLFSCGWNGVWRWSGRQWTQFKQTNDYVYSIYGISEKHLFLADNSKLLYYDGSSWTILKTGGSQSFIYAKIWCTANEVFVAFTDGSKTYVLHGK